MDSKEITFDKITAAVEQFKQKQSKFENEQVEMLVKAFEANPELVKSLRKYGLPEKFFVHEDFDMDLQKKLSWFAPVHRNSRIERDRIIFKWAEVEFPQPLSITQ